MGNISLDWLGKKSFRITYQQFSCNHPFVFGKNWHSRRTFWKQKFKVKHFFHFACQGSNFPVVVCLLLSVTKREHSWNLALTMRWNDTHKKPFLNKIRHKNFNGNRYLALGKACCAILFLQPVYGILNFPKPLFTKRVANGFKRVIVYRAICGRL